MFFNLQRNSKFLDKYDIKGATCFNTKHDLLMPTGGDTDHTILLQHSIDLMIDFEQRLRNAQWPTISLRG